MRILEVNQCHYRRGGADVVYLETGKLFESKGHQIAYFSTANSKNETTSYDQYFLKNIDLRKASLFEKVRHVREYLYNKEAVEKLKQLITDFRPDVAHIHLFYASLSVSVLETLKNYNIPIVHTIHDYRLLCPVDTLLDTNKQVCEKCAQGGLFYCMLSRCSEKNIFHSTVVNFERLFWHYFKSPLHFIDHFHFVSQFCMQKHINYLPELKSKSSFHYNFSKITKEPSENSESYYLYYGRLAFQKGVLTLVHAWKEMPDNLKLKIVGTGSHEKQVQRYIKKFSLNNIELLGYKTGNELTTLIQSSHFVLVPSEWYENNPMTIIEAYKLGVPVIGANIGGIPELIQSKKTGFIFEPKNKNSLIKTLIKSKALCREEYAAMVQNCKAFADQYFSSDSNYEYLLSVFNSVLKLKKAKWANM